MKMKKLTAILLSTVMVLGLAGCGSQNTQNSQNSAPSVQTAGGALRGKVHRLLNSQKQNH